MADKLWKATERKVARIFGGERVPVTGRSRGDVPDIRHRWLSVEVKTRRALPLWLRDALAQARAAATPQQLAVVILHQRGLRHGEDLVVLRLADWVEWFGGDHMPPVGRHCPRCGGWLAWEPGDPGRWLCASCAWEYFDRG